MHATPPDVTPPRPPADPDGMVPATLLLSSYEMFHRLMAVPWGSRPPARVVSKSRP